MRNGESLDGEDKFLGHGGAVLDRIEDLVGDFLGDEFIPAAFRIHDDDGSLIAEVHAAGAADLHGREPAIVDLLGEVLQERGGFLFVADSLGSCWPEAAADEYVVFRFCHGGVLVEMDYPQPVPVPLQPAPDEHPVNRRWSARGTGWLV